MRAIAITSFGGPEVLRVVEFPLPRPGPGEVLIQVAAAGINRPDILQRSGRYPPPPGASEIPGLEVAGKIAALGQDVRGFRSGEAVCALLSGGGYAEYATAPATQCLPIPGGFSEAEAASLPETFFTVWSNVFDRAKLAKGETLLVHGGSSGIGVTAIQLARAFGHRVFATAGSAEKCAACEALGAARAINYREQDFVEIVRTETAGTGVDVILDMVAGDYVARNLRALADDGRIVIIAFLGGANVSLDLTAMLMRRLTLTGSTLRARPSAFKAKIADALRREVWPLLEAGKIWPVVHAAFPLERAADAHRLMESGAHVGKIVLTLA
ncbi:MAG: NAD(P)H-quinone oxidoreductase [Burkholderiales bacterium]|nr:NAD(P)H-quinone oxidoreductase [Burkholderiales bacterium]